MYDKLERLKYMIEDIEISDHDRNKLIDYIDDLERDLENESDRYTFFDTDDE